MLLYAKALKNPGRPLLRNPAVWIEANTIKFVGAREDLPEAAKTDPEIIAVQEACLYPGFINAHCHLELTFLNQLSFPGDFVTWIRKVIQEKNDSDPDAQSRSLKKGILLSLLGGTTTVVDHVSFNADLESLVLSPLRGRAVIEVLGVSADVANEINESAKHLKKLFSSQSPLWEVYPSPHSVHALEPRVLNELMSEDQQFYSIHLGESQAEEEYFSKGTGALQELISERGSPLYHPQPSAVQELEEKGFLNSRVLAIHGNYFSEADLKLVAKRKVSVVHCPLSHQYFGHRPFPMEEAKKAGINLALGTDSLASSDSLSMLDILRATKKSFPSLNREEIFSMATVGGSKALRMENQIGEVKVGAKADIIGLRALEEKDPLELLFGAEQVEFSMINGQILIG